LAAIALYARATIKNSCSAKLINHHATPLFAPRTGKQPMNCNKRHAPRRQPLRFEGKSRKLDRCACNKK
jgi:hypothetical protein